MSNIFQQSQVFCDFTTFFQKVDWEVELCVVIGKTAVDVSEQCALNYIMGCTVGQDITARDWQQDANEGQFLLGKVRMCVHNRIETT